MHIRERSFGLVWDILLNRLVEQGEPVSPRQQFCHEILGVNLEVMNSRANVLINDVRKPQYRFMVAEWLWMTFGFNDVATIEQYNPKIAQFSDNGIDFNGAYGVPIIEQWDRVVGLLHEDPDTRQAVFSIYRTPKVKTKDVPCTIALQLLLRNGKLNCIATMRSSDIWLGLPYDVFNFTMIQNVIAGILRVEPGWFAINLGSSHLYDRNLEEAKQVLVGSSLTAVSPALPGYPPPMLAAILKNPRFDVLDIPKIWHRYANVLAAPNNACAREVLET